MIFIGDGDLIRNDFKRTGQISPAAYDRYTGKTFGNKEFFMNCVDYLCDDFGLIEVRNKEVNLRLIDKTKTDKTDKRNKLRFVNTVLPALLVLLFGVLNYWLRKRRYA
jgi:ABC-2 type transport system permease protein